MATAESVLKVARRELSQGEHPPGSNHNKYTVWYNDHVDRIGDGPWCDMFVSWVADQAGASKAVGRFAYTPYHAGWFRDNGRWGQTPKVGAVAFFDWGGSHSISAIDHVGFVEAVRLDGSVVTLEGNTSDLVMRRVRRSGIAGYGYPAYTAAPKPPPVKPGKAPRWPGRVITQPPVMHGDDVTTWQRQMRKRGWGLAADGAYGPKSESACRRFQASHHLTVDGEVGRFTWAAVWELPTG
jgi:hypothetical protein